MDVAVIKGISDGDENYAEKMKGRTLTQKNSMVEILVNLQKN